MGQGTISWDVPKWILRCDRSHDGNTTQRYWQQLTTFVREWYILDTAGASRAEVMYHSLGHGNRHVGVIWELEMDGGWVYTVFQWSVVSHATVRPQVIGLPYIITIAGFAVPGVLR